MKKIPASVIIRFDSGTTVIAVLFLLVGYFLGNVFQLTGTAIAGQAVQGTTQQPSQPTQKQGPIKFDIPSYVPFKGADSAKVAVIEFGDYQCPFCERFFQQTEAQILKDYVNSDKVKFYFMDFQFLGSDSQTLGQGAWCANDQGKYYDYHDYIYSHQGQENSGWATPDKVKTIVANIAGLDVQKFSSCLESKKYESRVQELTKLGQTNGVSGTPTVFIGTPDKGYTPVVGAQPYAIFKQIIDSQLSA